MQHIPSMLGRTESDALATRIRQQLAARGFGLWAMEVPGVANFIGFLGLSVPAFEAPFTPCVEIGWRLAFAHWGCGYATEAGAAAVAHAFGPLALQELVAFTIAANTRSRRVMERLGMRHSPVDDFKHPGLPAGHPLRTHVLYRLRRADWMLTV